MNNLGKVLMVVNPVAQSGKGNKAGSFVFNLLRRKYKQNTSLIYTQHEGHAVDILSKAAHFDTIVAVGGDGLVHECVSGLIQIPKVNRPNFAVVPVGSGNDYAKSLNISAEPFEAVKQIMYESKPLAVDVGRVNDKVFVETLSIGLDAAIAIGSEELRKKRGQSGQLLYYESGVNEIVHKYKHWHVKAKLDPGTDHEKTIDEKCILLCVQIGKTYGGGFIITPDAEIDDGIFNLCYTTGKISRLKALTVYSFASKGFHTIFKCMCFDTAHEVELEAEEGVMCQLDGEKYLNTKFHIVSLDKAINVYRIIK